MLADDMSQSFKYTPLEGISVRRPVDRIRYITAACAGCRVLDLGAMDETAWTQKRDGGVWLHEKIARVARQVDGVDNSRLIPDTGLVTAANAMIRRGNVIELGQCLANTDEVPEVIVAAELIEHLENPLQFLRQFAEIRSLAGKTLVLSTPNSTAIHNVLIGLASRESTHQDHLCIFSYKTLTTLCRRAGFSSWEIIPYFSRFAEMRKRVKPGVRSLAISAAERLINGFEWAFPMLSFGYIVRVSL